jgi:hypothetical protein
MQLLIVWYPICPYQHIFLFTVSASVSFFFFFFLSSLFLNLQVFISMLGKLTMITNDFTFFTNSSASSRESRRSHHKIVSRCDLKMMRNHSLKLQIFISIHNSKLWGEYQKNCKTASSSVKTLHNILIHLKQFSTGAW